MYKKTLVLLLVAILSGACMGKKQDTTKNDGKQDVKIWVSGDEMGQASSCTPTVEWNAVRLPDSPSVTYDVSVYKAVKKKSKFAKDTLVYSKVKHPITSVSILKPLDPNTGYFWSVRVRKMDGQVSQWSSNSKTVKKPAVPAEYKGHWHGFITPSDC